MIQDPLKEGIAVPVKKWHMGMSCMIPLCPLCAVDDPDELHQKLTENRWRTVSSSYCRDDQIHVNAKAKKIDNGYHVANLVNGSLCLGLVCIKDIHALLCVGNHVTHMHLLDHAWFFWGKKDNGLMELASLLRVVTLLVAKFPHSMCAAKDLSTIWMEGYFDRMLNWSCSLVINRVWQIRSAKEVGQEARGWLRTTSMPLDGVAKVMLLTVDSLKLISAHTWRSMSFVIPFLALYSLSSSPGSWYVNVPGVAIGCVKACAGGLGRNNFWWFARLAGSCRIECLSWSHRFHCLMLVAWRWVSPRMGGNACKSVMGHSWLCQQPWGNCRACW